VGIRSIRNVNGAVFCPASCALSASGQNSQVRAGDTEKSSVVYRLDSPVNEWNGRTIRVL
jgi:hypothetical protein